MNLDTPEGRYAASQALGHAGYNAAMAAHAKANTVAVVNGYSLRWVTSERFGPLCMVQEAKVGFRTLEQAKVHAAGLEPYRALPDRSYGTLKVSEREEAFLIAAIRLWQSIQTGSLSLLDANGQPYSLDRYEDILTSGWTIPPLNAAEIDDMAMDVLHLDPWLSEEECTKARQEANARHDALTEEACEALLEYREPGAIIPDLEVTELRRLVMCGWSPADAAEHVQANPA